MLKIKCFGDFQVEFDNKIITNFETEKNRALLAYLAVESDRPLRRSHLAGLLWSDESEQRALHNLRQALSRLRKTMREQFCDQQYLLAERESIQLNPCADIWVDTTAFSEAAQQTYQYYQIQNGRGSINYRSLKQALNFYQGEFLAQFSSGKSTLFDEWVLLMREKYTLQMIKMLSDLAVYYERRAEYHLALETAQHLVGLAPWDETARRQVLNLYGVTQQWSAATSQFMAFRSYLSEQFNAEPSSDLITLHDRIEQAAKENLIIESKFQPTSYSLPEGLPIFIGREKELDQLMEMVINPEIRLISMVGTGGIGKTSLSIHLAHSLVGVFSGGVYFVPCLRAQNPEQLIRLMGDVIGLVFNDQSIPKNQLFDYLHQKEMLLVLDNFEHLISDVENIQLVDQLMVKTEMVTVLITSREKINLHQEHCYHLSGLNCPAEDTIGLEEVDHFDAVTLFVNRMRHFNPNFKLEEINLMAVIQICRVLDGLPLGIELAAASAWELGCETIAQRIQEDMSILSTKFHNVLPRHRNLRVVFDVSWVLLTPNEQLVLACLSIFRGGFERQAALAIAQAEPNVLSALVSKSLVRIRDAGRFELHETICQFAAERLDQFENKHDVQTRHAQYYAGFLSEKAELINSQHQAAVLAAMQQEYRNLYGMWNELVHRGLYTELLACVDSIYQFFSIRSLLREGIDWMAYAIKNLPPHSESEEPRGILLAYLGALAYQAQQHKLAFDSLSAGQEILKKYNNQVNLAFCRLQLGWFYWGENDFPAAEDCAQQALTIYQALQGSLGKAEALFLLGNIRQKRSKNKEAEDYFEKALFLCRQSGHQRLLVLILNRMSDLACYAGQYEAAVEQFTECLQISQNLKDQNSQAILLNNLGTIYHVWKEYAKAQDYYQRSLIICREIGDQNGAALALNNLGESAIALGNFLNALKYVQEALHIAEQNETAWTKIVCLNSMGELYLEMGQHEKSAGVLMRALRLAVDTQGLDLMARTAINLGRVLQMQGEVSNALLLYQAAVAHSSTAHELREKALIWLEQIGGDALSNPDDALLTTAVNKILM